VSNDPDAAGPGPDARRTPDAQGADVNLSVVTVGPGTVTISPSGASCGVGCVTLPAQTVVTVTPSVLLGGAAQPWTGPCAGTPDGDPCVFTLTADTTLQANFVCTGDYVVLAGAGSDAASGACGAPFKTIAHALTASLPGQTIRLLPGTYDVANGETFPMLVMDRTLVGDESDQGMATIISGNGGNVVRPGGTTVIAGLTITAGADGIYADVAASTVTIRNNQLTGNSVGVWFQTAGSYVVTDNLMFSNTSHGIAHITGAPSVRYERNRVYLNPLGVETDSNNADFGGGPLGSTGGNHFYCNTRNDLWIYQTIPLSARNNFFDHTPPTTGADGSGIDAYQALSGTIDTAGAQLTTMPCP